MAELIHQLRNSRFVPILVLGVALAILGLAIGLGTERLRRSLRAQMVNRDGDTLHAVALAQPFTRGVSARLSSPRAGAAESLELALELSQLKDDVLAVRVYDPEGRFVTAFPPYVAEASLGADTLAELRRFHPVSRYVETARLSELILAEESASSATNLTPLLEVNIPIHRRGEAALLGTAQLTLDARNLEREFSKLDQHLWRQGAGAFVMGGGLLTAVLLWAYRRLEQSHCLLRERTAHLLRANHELTLAAKTGALGAVTAHLVHGLSNPLADLQDFINTHNGAGEDEDWNHAVAAARRMQSLVHEVVRVLGEERETDQYEITFVELAEILSAKVKPTAEATGVECRVQVSASGQIANRQANLVLLILENLVHNALQVTPRGQAVKVSLTAVPDAVVCTVADRGPGFPAQLRKSLFAPCRSTKGGSGLGLAISQQLARQLGAQLELARTGPEGCVFTLTLAPALLGDAPPEPAPAFVGLPNSQPFRKHERSSVTYPSQSP